MAPAGMPLAGRHRLLTSSRSGLIAMFSGGGTGRPNMEAVRKEKSGMTSTDVSNTSCSLPLPRSVTLPHPPPPTAL